MKKNLLALSCLALFMSSCNNEDIASDVLNSLETTCERDFVGDVSFTIENEENNDSKTRTTVRYYNSSSWNQYDEIGIFGITETNDDNKYSVQVPCIIKNTEFGTSTSTTPTTKVTLASNPSWGFKEGRKYAAYSPFNKDMKVSQTLIPINYEGQVQSNASASTADHMANYDYMYAAPVTPVNGQELNFKFKKIGIIADFLFTNLPNKQWTKVKVVNANNEKVFKTQGTLDILTGNVNVTKASSSMEIGVSIEGERTSLEVFIGMLPTNMGKIYCILTDSEGNDYVSPSITSYNIPAGSYTYRTFNMKNTHTVVDLGLPSGTLWACYNIGATESTLTDEGDFFAWGETESKRSKSDSPYKWMYTSTNYSIITKYTIDISYGATIDSLSTLLPEDDAATVNWGAEWCTPTIDQQVELLRHTTAKWYGLYDGFCAPGTLLTSTVNGKSIFIPACHKDKYEPIYYKNVPTSGTYWSSSLKANSENMYAYSMTVSQSNGFTVNDAGNCRPEVHSIRAVYKK